MKEASKRASRMEGGDDAGRESVDEVAGSKAPSARLTAAPRFRDMTECSRTATPTQRRIERGAEGNKRLAWASPSIEGSGLWLKG